MRGQGIEAGASRTGRENCAFTYRNKIEKYLTKGRGETRQAATTTGLGTNRIPFFRAVSNTYF
jgi:hypothetical protein